MVYFEKSDALKRLPKQFFADLVVKTNAAIAKGYDVINLGQGNPDQPTPPHIVKSLQEAAANPLYHKYSPFRGYDFLKEAIAAFYKREYDVAIDPKTEVAILFGSKTGLVEIGECILNSGDTVLMPDPGYPDYLSGFALANLNMETMPLRAENAFLPDYASMPDTLLDKAKLMFLNYPNNPTSATAPADFFEETVKVAEKHNICVLHDLLTARSGSTAKAAQLPANTGSKRSRHRNLHVVENLQHGGLACRFCAWKQEHYRSDRTFSGPLFCKSVRRDSGSQCQSAAWASRLRA
ncbi:glutamine-dependent 2-keto-4-methylthiobutyrate transaminase [Sporolactobacillus inulinus]|uniref:Glutamine-dependent 2-keto-4-methylthiobutyrate transaminase n=1 Tax=Sporolactobacillus inulinus TaxID=2078 RepID=A0A4Y1ZEL6_9BACL|nr:glutamine-dependent 2-keto-4-methylthiobutyrate transaminase [Sporolactobacillus inulinus]